MCKKTQKQSKRSQINKKIWQINQKSIQIGMMPLVNIPFCNFFLSHVPFGTFLSIGDWCLKSNREIVSFRACGRGEAAWGRETTLFPWPAARALRSSLWRLFACGLGFCDWNRRLTRDTRAPPSHSRFPSFRLFSLKKSGKIVKMDSRDQNQILNFSWFFDMASISYINHHFLAPRLLKPLKSSPRSQNLPGEPLTAHSERKSTKINPKTAKNRLFLTFVSFMKLS